MKKNAFTLIELLVVVAIIALLLSILLPALKAAKKYAALAVCLSNQKSISQAWLIYAENNDGWLVDGDTEPEDEQPYDGWSSYTDIQGRTVRARNFCSPPQNATHMASNTGLADKIRGFQMGGLWDYLKTPDVYHCPADKRFAKDPTLGYRSYSMGAVLSARGYNYTSASSSGEAYAVARQMHDFVNPSDKIVWLEESDIEQEYNHRTWNVDIAHRRWVDPFAIWHNNGSTFGYADGHAENHKWQEKTTIEMADIQLWAEQHAQKGVPIPADEPRDFNWFVPRYIPGRVPGELQPSLRM